MRKLLVVSVMSGLIWAGPAVRGSAVGLAHSTRHPAPSERTLQCIGRWESGNNYRAVSKSGRYRGAYQFRQGTWNGIAIRTENHHLTDVDPAYASPEDQDMLASALYQERGLQPWSKKVRSRCR